MFINILICQLLSGLSMCVSLPAITTDGFSGTIRLFDNGAAKNISESASYRSESPFCENKEKISLTSYSLRIKEKCINGNARCRLQTVQPSSETILLLHEGCSFKDECDHLNFATVAHNHFYNNSLHSLLVGYNCLGEADKLYELCEDRVEIITGTMHLITGKRSRQFSKCQCLLKGENDSMIVVKLKDVRLYSKDISQRKCSKSVLKLDDKTFACNSSSNALGSVFNEVISLAVHNDSTIVSLDVKDDFDMLWLTVETQGSLSVECTKRTNEMHIVRVNSNTESDIIPYAPIDSQSGHDSSRDFVWIVLTLPILPLCVAIAVVVRKRRTCMIRRERVLKASKIDNKTAIAEENDDLKTEEDEQPACSSSNTNKECLLRDESLVSKCYKMGITGAPVQELKQDGSDESAEGKHHIYAPLNHYLSKDSGLEIPENEIYSLARFKKQIPQRDPTYNRLPVVCSQAKYNYARTRFLTTQL